VGIQEAAQEASHATRLSPFCAIDYSQMSSFIGGSFSGNQKAAEGR